MSGLVELAPVFDFLFLWRRLCFFLGLAVMGTSAPSAGRFQFPGHFLVPGCPCPAELVWAPPLLVFPLLLFVVPFDYARTSTPEETSRQMNREIPLMQLPFIQMIPGKAGELQSACMYAAGNAGIETSLSERGENQRQRDESHYQSFYRSLIGSIL